MSEREQLNQLLDTVPDTKIEYSRKSAIGALYDQFSKEIDSMKKGDVYMIDEAWEKTDKI